MSRVVLLVAAVALVGCAQAPTACPSVLPQTYVLAAWNVPLGPGTSAPGVDLDGRPGTAATRACADARDFTSPVSGETEVDNQWASSVAPILDGLTDGGIATASLAQIQVGDGLFGLVLSSGDDGPEAVMHALLPSATVALDPSGRALEAGQTFFSIRRLTPVVLCLGPTQLGLVLSSMDAPLGLPTGTTALHGVRIRLVVTDGVITGAELGGTVEVATLVAALGSSGIDETTIRSAAAPDLLPRSELVCDGISVGAELVLASATIE